MGSYLELNSHETNSKTYSGIIIDAIRFVDNNIYKNNIEEYKNFLIPDSYKTVNGERIGIGDWTINKKGMVLIIKYLNSELNNEEYIKKLAYEGHEYYLTHLVDLTKYEEELNKFIDESKEDVKFCINYLTDILLESIMENKNKIKAKWI